MFWIIIHELKWHKQRWRKYDEFDFWLTQSRTFIYQTYNSLQTYVGGPVYWISLNQCQQIVLSNLLLSLSFEIHMSFNCLLHHIVHLLSMSYLYHKVYLSLLHVNCLENTFVNVKFYTMGTKMTKEYHFLLRMNMIWSTKKKIGSNNFFKT